MQPSYPFYVYSGLLTKEHRKRIGSALWEFLWCINKTTKEIEEDGEKVGLVLGGKPINLSDIANELGGSKSTIHRNIEKLEEEGYLTLVRAPYGIIIKVRNSKKWLEQGVLKTEQKPNIFQKTVRKTGQPFEKRDERSKNDNSNKDKPIDKTNDYVDVVVDNIPFEKRNADSLGMPSPQGAAPVELDADSSLGRISAKEYRKAIEDRYIQRRGRGFDLSMKDIEALDELMREKVPLPTVLEGIDKAFDEYKPQHSLDKIRSLKYCVPIILDLHVKKQKEANLGDGAHWEGAARHSKASGDDETASRGYYAGLGIGKRL